MIAANLVMVDGDRHDGDHYYPTLKGRKLLEEHGEQLPRAA